MKPSKDLSSGIGLDILWSLLSCGIYTLFWQNRVFKAINAMNDDERFSFWPWFLLTLVTCGIYNFYIQYKLGEALIEGQKKLGVPVNDTMAWLGLLLTIFGLHMVTLALDQNEINKIVA